MKFATYAEYDPKGLALSVPGLLTVWAGIQRFHEELVLVGGLVPHFICRHPESSGRLPRPATLDVDIGIALGASSGQYGSLAADLQGQGFRLSKNFPSRFERVVEPWTIYLDFLVEHPPAITGTVMVDDVPANVLPGIDRALSTARTQEISGTDLFGAAQRFSIRVCEVGPFLALKLRAFAGRQAPKDAFDILYTLRHYDGGTPSAVAAFAAEVKADNPAIPDALACLKQHFGEESDSAPTRAAHFVFGPVDTGETDDVQVLRRQIQQDVVTLGAALIAVI
ncbi:MAG: nucleotidyl transferase AbiEii/AbiGii toxin family protein [Opitutaceae bacterium]|nr:nucleotidyl transferase AbiEii/AbiGii toxin family protein [Opitutaceae bacterium]